MIEIFLSLSNTDKIALLALIVATYAAILSTVIFLKERFNISLKLLTLNYLSFFHEDTNVNFDKINLEFYKSNKSTFNLFIKMRLFNNSKNPCTISEFILNSKYKTDSQSKMYASHIPAFYLQSNGRLYSNTFVSVSPMRQPLIFLNPYQTIECFICFQNVKHINKFALISVKGNNKSKTFVVKLNIKDCTKIRESSTS